MITEELEERFAIISEGCKISQSYAERLHAEQVKAMACSEDHYAAKVKRLRELVEAQRKPVALHVPRIEPVVSRKELAGGGK